MPMTRKSVSQLSGFGKEFESILFESNPLPMWVFDSRTYAFLAVNNAAMEMYGYTGPEFLAMKVSEIRPDEDLPRFNAAVSAAGQSVLKPMGEWRHRRKNGEILFVEVHASEISFEGRKAIISVLHDITKSKLAESNLRQALDWQDAVFQGSRDAVFISDTEAKFVSVNQAACELTGYTESELLAMSIPDLHEDTDLSAFKTFHRSIMEGEPALTEAPVLRKDGRKIHVEFSNRRIIPSGTPYMHTTARDITDRKRAEENSKRYEHLFKNLTEMVLFLRDSDKRIIEANEAAQNAFGYSREEMLSMTGYDLLEPSAAKQSPAPDLFGRAREIVYRRKDGTFFHAEVRGKKLTIDGEEMIVGIGRDITGEKETEAALRKSEALYSELIRSMPVGYYLSTSEGRFLEVNPAFCKMLGYERSEMLAMNIPQTLYFSKTERQGEKKYTGFSPVTEVYRLKGKNGAEVWIEDYARYIRDEDGRILYHEGLCKDITQRKRALDALQFSESRFRAVVENSSDTILFLDNAGRQIECLNMASYQRITGYAADQRLGQNLLGIIHPHDVRQAREILLSEGRRGEVVRLECRIRRYDGSWRWVEATARNMLSDPSIRAIVVSMRDIEERKAAEELLVESEERYRSLVDNSPDAIIVITDGVCVYVNRASLAPIKAVSADQLIGKAIVDFIHPDSIDATVARISRMLETQSPLPAAEIKLIAFDGSMVEVEVRSAPIIYLGKRSIQVTIRNFTERRQIERQLQLQGVALNTAANAILITNKNGEIVWVNPAFENLTGYSMAEALGKNPGDLLKSGAQEQDFYRLMWETVSAGKVWRGELLNRRKDGTLYTEEMTVAPVRDERGDITHFVAVQQDITDRKSLQEQLLQSQKLESIGQLAGGVAHDYNNILGVVIGYAELLRSKFKDDYETNRSIDVILAAATRGADLTRQLLAFARKEMISPRVLNINRAIESIEKMLRRIIGENIDLVLHPEKDLWNVRIDPSQFDQILVNFAANSRDAIKGIGTITIRTENVTIRSKRDKKHAVMIPGEYVRVSFTDTGIGMTQETIERIFEPFFTTKEKGHGTGLGLSTVYGIVTQNKGYIYAASKPDEGTTFEVYLQRCLGEIVADSERRTDPGVHGSETILVVEDQPEMLELAKASLEKYGYRVLAALGPGEALLICDDYAGKIHLLLTDVIMPVMSGRDLSESVRITRPEIKTLFMSGYTANELDPEGVLDGNSAFIQKPFTPAGLAKKVQEALRS